MLDNLVLERKLEIQWKCVTERIMDLDKDLYECFTDWEKGSLTESKVELTPRDTKGYGIRL